MKELLKKIAIIVFVIYLTSVMSLTITKNKNVFKEAFDNLKINEEYKNNSKYEKIVMYKDTFEDIFNNKIYKKDNYIDIYGLFQKTLLKKVVEDVDDQKRVVKMNNGKLTFVYPKWNIDEEAEKVINLSQYAKEKDIYMVYINIPWRVKDNSELPFYIKDYVTDTNNKMLKKLSTGNVNIIDLENILSGDYDSWFYDTDHHWTTETAFESYKIIIKNINDELDIGLTGKYLNNFTRKVYKDIFLGTYGKRVGKYYDGMDDFVYITPYFDTKFEVINYRNVGEVESIKKGNFTETFTYPEFLDRNLDRDLSVYYTYSKGTKAEVNITNLNAYNNKKLLILKDSFADSAYPFLALNFQKTKVIDVRRYKAIRLHKYIERYNPDVIIFLQNAQSLYDKTLFNWQEK